MTRFAPLTLLVLLTPAVAAPVPKAVKKPAAYFPLRFGDKWEFVDGKESVTEEVSGVTPHDDGSFTAVVKLTGGGGHSIEYKVDADAVGRSKMASNTLDPPLRMVPTVMKAGDEWDTKFRYGSSDWHYRLTVGEAEDVTVPAGKFRAVPVTCKRLNGDRVVETIIDWYADGVGLVKVRHDDGTVKELVKYTPGK